MMVPKISDIYCLQEKMAEQRSRGTVLEFEATVDEIQDNMNSILGKVSLKGIITKFWAGHGWLNDHNAKFTSSFQF